MTDALPRQPGAGVGRPVGPAASGALAAAAFLAVSHAWFLGPWAGAVFACALALVRPGLAAPLCIAATLVQDAPGLGGTASRAAVAGCALLHLVHTRFGAVRAAGAALRIAGGAALAAVGVAFVVSAAGAMGWGHPQAASRPFVLVALADAGMIVAGASIGAGAMRDPALRRALSGAVCVGLLGMALRLGGQLAFGPLTGFSEAGTQSIAAAAQLSGTAANGAVRYVGSMLTPNAMSMACILCLLFLWILLPRPRFAVAVAFGACAIAAALLAGTKSSFAVAVAMQVLLPLGVLRPLAVAVHGAAVAGVDVLLWTTPFVGSLLANRMRASTVSLEAIEPGASAGAPPSVATDVAAASAAPAASEAAAEAAVDAVRAGGVNLRHARLEEVVRSSGIHLRTVRDAGYRACIEGLPPRDAVLGRGLSNWPAFFQEWIGQPMADPHSAVFSYPWTYGIAGVGALAAASVALAAAAWRTPRVRAVALVLLGILLVRDMVAIPLLIGTTVLTLQVWACIGAVLSERVSDAAEAAG